MAKILEPHDRPKYDWRDPDMKVLRFGFEEILFNGVVIKRTRVTYEATPEEVQDLAKQSMNNPAGLNHVNDPSYHWRREGRKRR